MSDFNSQRTERIIQKCFYGNEKIIPRISFTGSQSQIVPQMRSQSMTSSVSSGRVVSGVVPQSQSMATHMESESNVSNVMQSQTQTQSEPKLLTNRELIHQILDSNRDKEVIERVTKSLNKFENTLNEMNLRLDLTQIETIVSKSVRNEVNKSIDLKEMLKKFEDENRSLKEEIIRLSAIESTERTHIQSLNQFKQQIIDSFPKSETIDSQNETQKLFMKLIQRIEEIFDEIKPNINPNINLNFTLNSRPDQIPDYEPIDWFDSI